MRISGAFLLSLSCVPLLGASINPQTPARQVPMKAPEQQNLHRVLDWWRQVIEAGHLELVPRYQADTYIQHNPNINTGRAGFLEAFGRDNSPVNPIPARLINPPRLAGARGDYVWMMRERRHEPAADSPLYYQYRFDLLRVGNWQVQEHWDANLKEAGTGAVNHGHSPRPPAKFDTGTPTVVEHTARAIAVEAATRVYLQRNLALAEKLIASDYIEHDPNLSTGHTLQARLSAFHPPSGLLSNEPVISIVNGEYVLMMWDVESPDPDDSTRSYPWNYFQLVRVHGNKIVEHWDQDAWHPSEQ
jgi:predicted SnoaL-like aldol condensation-catalyzing enzyme